MEELKQLANTHPYWSLDEFAHVVNQWLPRCLPEERANTRVREDVNPRLIRQYTTSGLVDAPLKEGREARYTYRHLLQLLVTRRLLADGYATAVIHKLVAGQDDAGLEQMLATGAMGAAAEASVNPAIAFLQGLTGRTRREESPPSPPASPMRSASAPSLKKMASPRPPASFSPQADWAEAESVAKEAFDEEEIADFLESPKAAAPAFEGAFEAACAPPPSLAPAPAPAPIPRRWTRLDVAPGLELNVRDDYRFPASPAEREALLTQIAQLLDTAHDA